jgi:hypothetical protein
MNPYLFIDIQCITHANIQCNFFERIISVHASCKHTGHFFLKGSHLHTRQIIFWKGTIYTEVFHVYNKKSINNHAITCSLAAPCTCNSSHEHEPTWSVSAFTSLRGRYLYLVHDALAATCDTYIYCVCFLLAMCFSNFYFLLALLR